MRSREQRHASCDRLRLEHAHAALVEEAVEQALARKLRVDQLVVLDRVDERLRLDPGVVLAGGSRRLARRMPFRDVAGRQVGLAHALGRGRQELHHQAAGAPGAAAGR